MATKNEKERQQSERRLQLQKQLESKASLAYRSGGAWFTHFLSPVDRQMAAEFAADRQMSVTFFGGYEDAQRVIAAVHAERHPYTGDWPIVYLCARWDQYAPRPRGADFRKAEKALGLPEDSFGDVVVGWREAYLMMEKDASMLALEKMKRVGKTPVVLSQVSDGILVELGAPQGRVQRVSLAAMELEQLVSAAWGFPREQAQQFLQSGKIMVNYIPALDLKCAVHCGDLVSCSGYGKVRLLTREGPNRTREYRCNLLVYANN